MEKLEDDVVGKLLGWLTNPQEYSELGLQAIYGFLIGFSFLTLIGALLTVCCNKYGCRHLMYFSCVFLVAGAFLPFLVAFLLSFTVPIFTWTCDYLDVTLASDTGYRSKPASMQRTSEH